MIHVQLPVPSHQSHRIPSSKQAVTDLTQTWFTTSDQSHQTSHTAFSHQNKQSPISPRHDLLPCSYRSHKMQSSRILLSKHAVANLIIYPVPSHQDKQSLVSPITLYPLIQTSSRWSHDLQPGSYQSHQTSHPVPSHQNKQSLISPRHDLRPVVNKLGYQSHHPNHLISSDNRPSLISPQRVTKECTLTNGEWLFRSPPRFNYEVRKILSMHDKVNLLCQSAHDIHL